LNKPVIKENINSYELVWADEQISIKVARIHEQARGIVAEITITLLTGFPNNHLHQSMFNLSALSARVELIKSLKKTSADIDWDSIIEQLCVYVPRFHRKGEPVETLMSDEDTSPPQQFIDPIILADEINMIFGEGGTGKSYLSLYLALRAARVGDSNPMKLGQPLQTTSTLLLDWETNKAQVQWRWHSLAYGMGLQGINIPIDYRRCALPLVDDLENIQNMILEKNSKFIIIDSVGAACAKDFNQPGIATEFMNSVRRLNVTTLLIHHTSKDREGRKTPFGSVYFTNASRSIFEIQEYQEPNTNVKNIMLSHVKHNYSGRAEPFGAKFVFNEDKTIDIQPLDVSTIPEFNCRLPLANQILIYLQDSGSKSIEKIAVALKLFPSRVKAVLCNNPDRFYRVEVGKGELDSIWDVKL
jgi:hypothetical protein